MIINTTKSPVIVGRFRILPGEKFPDVAKTAQESNAITTFLKKGIFKEMAPEPVQPAKTAATEQPAKAAVTEQPAKAPAKAKEAKSEQKPEPAKAAQASPEQEKSENK